MRQKKKIHMIHLKTASEPWNLSVCHDDPSPAGQHGSAGEADPDSGKEEHSQGQAQAGPELPAEAAVPRR